MSRQTLIRRFTERPPRLEGGLRLDIEPLDDRRALLLVEGAGEQRFRARAAGLSVPYPSGLKRLLGAGDDIEVVLVEHASRGLEFAAAEQDVGYLDLHGRGRLIGPGFVYVVTPHHLPAGGADVEERSDRPEAFDDRPVRRPARVSPFAPKASRIARVLLSDPHRGWRVFELADRCGMNPGNVHRVLAALTDQGFVERDGDGYVLMDPGSLLEAWADQGRRSRVSERLMIPVRDDIRSEVARVLESLDWRGAVSGELAAELYAPHLRATHAIVHCVDQGVWDPERLSALAGVPSLRRQGDVAVELADEGVADLGDVRDGLPLVAPQQLYVDLYRDRTRAREAAEHVRREVLGF